MQTDQMTNQSRGAISNIDFAPTNGKLVNDEGEIKYANTTEQFSDILT